MTEIENIAQSSRMDDEQIILCKKSEVNTNRSVKNRRIHLNLDVFTQIFKIVTVPAPMEYFLFTDESKLLFHRWFLRIVHPGKLLTTTLTLSFFLDFIKGSTQKTLQRLIFILRLDFINNFF